MRAERAAGAVARMASERDALGDEGACESAKKSAEASVATLQKHLQANTEANEAAETRRTELIAARDGAQASLASAKAELAGLLTEQNALERSLAKGDGDKAINRIKVRPGYERALAAALGDDADATIGGDAGRRWLGGTPAMDALADNALIHYVDAPQELAARLSHVRVVEQDDGAALKPGERVVTLSGQLRRWDGFATDGDGATTAELLVRANRLAELNALIPPAEAALTEQAVAPKKGQNADECIAVCATCTAAAANAAAHTDHWRCLSDSMWSPVPAVQVSVYRLLAAVGTEWANDLKDSMYLDESTLDWAESEPTSVVHKDAYGVLLQHGDTVVLTEHLDVKGTNFTAKKGTVVRNIRLDRSNAEYLEGRVEGQEIVILTKFVKRQARD
jgi:uncharacterized Zn ribbon protein